MTDTTNDEAIERLLDSHAEYYIKQTLKFFQENGESPALSKNNAGDLKAKAAIHSLIRQGQKQILENLLPVGSWTEKDIKANLAALTTGGKT